MDVTRSGECVTFSRESSDVRESRIIPNGLQWINPLWPQKSLSQLFTSTALCLEPHDKVPKTLPNVNSGQVSDINKKQTGGALPAVAWMGLSRHLKLAWWLLWAQLGGLQERASSARHENVNKDKHDFRPKALSSTCARASGKPTVWEWKEEARGSHSGRGGLPLRSITIITTAAAAAAAAATSSNGSHICRNGRDDAGRSRRRSRAIVFFGLFVFV